MVAEGTTRRYRVDVKVNSEITQLKMTARDKCRPRGDPICVASSAVVPPKLSNRDRVIYFTGSTLAECGAPWYHGRDTITAYDATCTKIKVPEKCVWMSEMRQSISVLKEALLINVPSNYAGDFDYAMYNDVASAIELCTSDTSYGPSFLSLKESLYCDMTTKTLIPMCNTQHAPVNNHTRIETGTCINSDGSFVTYQTSKNSQLSARDLTPTRVPLKFLGPPPGSVETPTVNTTLSKRAETCNLKLRTKISAGQRLWSGEQLTSSDGSKRYIVQSDGNSVIYDNSGNVLWTLGQYIAWPRGTFYAELQRDG
ncbi:MAG: hypothetical protein J3Q66DRAFT_332753, partial [Benniella sp.]